MRRPTNIVTIVVTTNTMFCALVESTASGLFRVSRCASYQLGATIIEGIPIQQIPLVALLRTYMNTHAITQSDVALCLANNAITEQFARMPTSAADGTCVHAGSRVSGYQSIAADDEGYYITARAEIPAAVVCSYQLLFAHTGLHLRVISGPTTASLAVYQRLYGSAYRQTQLATDLVTCNYQINTLLPDAMIDRLVAQPTDQQWEKRIVRYTIGLALGYKEIS